MSKVPSKAKRTKAWKQLEREMLEKLVVFIYISVFIFVFLTMDYNDGRINAGIGYSLVQGLFEGNFVEVFNSMDYSYGFTIYFIYAIWSLPLATINAIFGRELDLSTAVGAVYWYKILLILFWIACAYQFYRLVLKYVADKKNAIKFALLLLTSSITFFPVLALTQCDVMSLFFMLLGINYLLEERNLQFVIAFAIAATMKYLALFLFIPIALLCFKDFIRWFKIGFATLTVLGVSLFIRSLSKAADATAEQEGYYISDHIKALWKGVSGEEGSLLGIGDISLTVTYFLCVVIVAYLLLIKDKKERIYWISWISLAAWYTIFIFYGANTYWYVLLAPFLLLVLFNNNKYFKLGLVIETVLTNLMLVERIITQDWVFGGRRTFSTLIMRKCTTIEHHLLFELFDNFLGGQFASYHTIFSSVILVLSFLLLVLFYPKNAEPANNCKAYRREIDSAITAHVFMLLFWTLCIIIANWYFNG